MQRVLAALEILGLCTSYDNVEIYRRRLRGGRRASFLASLAALQGV